MNAKRTHVRDFVGGSGVLARYWIVYNEVVAQNTSNIFKVFWRPPEFCAVGTRTDLK